MSFHKPESNLVVPGSLYLMLLLAFAMIFFSFQPVQEAEASGGAIIAIILAVIRAIIGSGGTGGDSSSCLPLVPEFVDVLEETSFLS
jgi:hypothetical protein